MVQWVKCLLCTYKDLSLALEHMCKKLNVAVCTKILNTERQKQEKLCAHWSAILCNH